MYSKGKSSNYSWLTILPRKIQKRFKRNRQKVEESASVNDIFDETSTEPQEIPAPSPSLPSTFDDDNTQADQQATRACEEMKIELFKLACYWPKLTRIEAQQLLSQQPNGSFLVRDSSEEASFTLSFRTNSKTFHCRKPWSQLFEGDLAGLSLLDIIKDTIKKSESSVVGYVKCDDSDASFTTPYAVRLMYPISRKISVPSLQSLCLSKIKCNVNQSNIHSLPLPNKIKEYVRENYNTL